MAIWRKRHLPHQGARPHPVALLLLIVSMAACDTGPAPDGPALPYRSMWAELYPATLHAETPSDTLQGAFRFAATAQTVDEARSRWSDFLSEWDPPNGEFEDAMHANLVTWARLERQRVDVLVADPSGLQAVDQQLRALARTYE